MKKITTRSRARVKIRKKVAGSADKPRLSVYRSLNNIYAQLIDDSTGNTVLSVSSLSPDLKTEIKSVKSKVEKSRLIGNAIAKKALAKNIKNVVFDRSGYKYHGRVKAVADGAREGGLVL
jgi:large subunit ribosomal protein L18